MYNLHNDVDALIVADNFCVVAHHNNYASRKRQCIFYLRFLALRLLSPAIPAQCVYAKNESSALRVTQLGYHAYR